MTRSKYFSPVKELMFSTTGNTLLPYSSTTNHRPTTKTLGTPQPTGCHKRSSPTTFNTTMNRPIPKSEPSPEVPPTTQHQNTWWLTEDFFKHYSYTHQWDHLVGTPLTSTLECDQWVTLKEIPGIIINRRLLATQDPWGT